MKIELIIIPEFQYQSSFLVKDEKILYRSIPIVDSGSHIHFDIKKIDFDYKKESTIYLLFCLNLSNYPELEKYSDRMILMNAIFPFVGKIIRSYNFAGIIPSSNFHFNTPILFGKKSVISNMENLDEHPPDITSDIYDSIYKKGYTMYEILHEYIAHYLDFVQNKNKES